MRQPMRVGLVLAALAAVVLGVTHLTPAKGDPSITPSGDAFAYRFDDILTLDGSSTSPNTVIATTTLPAGSYVVTAKLIAFAGKHTYSRVVCTVQPSGSGYPAPPADRDVTSTTVGIDKGAAEDQSVSLLLAKTLTSSAQFELDCWSEESKGPLPSISDASLVVLPVSSISTY